MEGINLNMQSQDGDFDVELAMKPMRKKHKVEHKKQKDSMKENIMFRAKTEVCILWKTVCTV